MTSVARANRRTRRLAGAKAREFHTQKNYFCFIGFPDSSVGRESTCNAGDSGSISGLGRSPGEENGPPSPVFWSGEFHGQYSPWGCKESDMTERLSLTQISQVKKFRVFLCMRRCKSLSSQKSFLSYASQLSGTNILCFPGLTIEGGCSLMASGWQVLFSSLSSLRVHWLTVEGCNG